MTAVFNATQNVMTQQTNTCSNLKIETLEKGLKYVQSYQ